ncbi:polysaccharide pyruvyl transferase family protein [Brachyspira sp. SAP_772]|uniref:polysaccharide pyruvyl transferase family protein n=1 Tax=Brachyspira sp. SAP_772 TaxID=2608385 RepID=UPI001E3B64CC|nr:polysaccharide pyruvyl transferase family protein [Brachyspira sp. SAP_772]
MKNNSIDILNKIECTGCSVCEKVCPHNAIEMIETKEGFRYPLIDEDRCTNCGLCVKKCHALNDNFKTNFKQEIYDVRASDDIRMKSSSGGMFTILANYVLENNGYVCGAAFTKDWLGVEHIIINNEQDLDKLRGSKYIESSLRNTFLEIKKLLNEKKQVLFSGCPCQVSALYSYLGKDYDNLITVDLLCNSIVPQKVWKKYLKELFTDEEIKNIEYVSFRDKEKFGWNADHKIYIKWDNREYISRGCYDIYIQSFLKHISVKEECLRCKYRKYERVGDISIGDYWGVKDNDNKGVGLTLINSKKAKYIFDIINSSFTYKNVTSIKPSNGGINGKIKVLGNRKYFFDNFDKESLKELFLNYDKFDICLVGFWFANNYGAILTYYALYKLLENLGFSILVLDTLDKDANMYNYYSKGIAREFAEKYYVNIFDNINKESLHELNNKCDMFITASDQLWNNFLSRDMVSDYSKYIYFLEFVENSKKKIAISTSVGDDNQKLYSDYVYNQTVKYYLSLFDYISIREKKTVNFFNENLNIKSDFVLDPVFLIDRKEYDKLIYNDENISDYIFCYVHSKEKVKEVVNEIALKINKKVIFSNHRSDGFIEKPEEWLSLIKNASCIITDGFHGTCFSIIYNKPFLCLRYDYYESNLNRINSILNLFDIKNRLLPISKDIVNETNAINYELLFYMDYTEINNILEKEKDRSLEWIKNALYSDKKIKDDDYKTNIINILIKENNELKINISKLNKNIIPKLDNRINQISDELIRLNNEKMKLINEIRENRNWIKFFGIYNTNNYIFAYLFGIKFTFRVNENSINKIAWWIPVKKWRESFRSKFKIRPDQTRPDQTRPDQK